jgi:hypothetical protein
MLVLPMPGALVSCLLLAVPTCVALFCACQCPEVYHPIRCVLWWSYVGLVVPRSSALAAELGQNGCALCAAMPHSDMEKSTTQRVSCLCICSPCSVEVDGLVECEIVSQPPWLVEWNHVVVFWWWLLWRRLGPHISKPCVNQQ